MPELKDRLNLKAVREKEGGGYCKLSGMMLLLTRRVPNEGDAVTLEGWRFELSIWMKKPLRRC